MKSITIYISILLYQCFWSTLSFTHPLSNQGHLMENQIRISRKKGKGQTIEFLKREGKTRLLAELYSSSNEYDTVGQTIINDSSYNNCDIKNLTSERKKVKSLSATSIIEQTEDRLYNQKQIQTEDRINEKKSFTKLKRSDLHEKANTSFNRRIFVGSALLSSSTAMNMNEASSIFSALPANAEMYAPSVNQLQYEKSPINKRSGITVFSAEKYGYNVRFVTYLSRLLLYFDNACQKWWYARAADIPRRATAEQVDMMRLNQFAAFSASVEVGLQEYGGNDGPSLLLDSLLQRYCPDKNSTSLIDPDAFPEKAARQLREIKEARRQIALLFGLMEVNQPVEKLTKLLAAIDDAEIMFVSIVNRGSGYAPGYGPPNVIFPPPAAGEDFRRATGRATLRPNGRLLRIDVKNRGGGYTKPPTVTISPPLGMLLSSEKSTKKESQDKSSSIESNDMMEYRQASASAILFRDGSKKGLIERIALDDPGSGYAANETIVVKVAPPGVKSSQGGITATATAVLEYEIESIKIVDGGSGYAAEQTLPIYVEPPPLTARANMNDPLSSKTLYKDSAKTKANLDTLRAQVEQDAYNNGKGGGGGCIGRACYDDAVVAIAFPRAEKDSYSSFNSEEEVEKMMSVEEAVLKRSAASISMDKEKRVVSGTVGGYGYDSPINPGLGTSSSASSQLLYLLPAGIGLEYNTKTKRYQLAAGRGFEDMNANWMQGSSSKPIFPEEFGPRGRSPVERQKDLDLASTLRFCLSGAICASGVHLILTPIDVVKTKVQTDPVKYKGVFRSFNKVLQDEGFITLFTGWLPTFIGFFFWGGLTYTTTEAFRRLGTTLMGNDAATLEVPIVVVAAGIASFLGSFILTPTEAVRIRSVAQPDYAESIAGVLSKMISVSKLFVLFIL